MELNVNVVLVGVVLVDVVLIVVVVFVDLLVYDVGYGHDPLVDSVDFFLAGNSIGFAVGLQKGRSVN